MSSKYSGLAQALNVVAERLRSQREAGEEMGRKKELLGSEEARSIRLLEKEASLKPTTQPIVDKTGKIIGYRPVGAVFQPSAMGFWDETNPEVQPPAQPTPTLPSKPNFFSPLFQPSKFERKGIFKYELKSPLTEKEQAIRILIKKGYQRQEAESILKQ